VKICLTAGASACGTVVCDSVSGGYFVVIPGVRSSLRCARGCGLYAHAAAVGVGEVGEATAKFVVRRGVAAWRGRCVLRPKELRPASPVSLNLLRALNYVLLCV